MAIELNMKGWAFKQIRQLSGYSARELGEFMKEEGLRPTTARGVYELETRYEIKPRHVMALRRFLGGELFDQCVEYLRRKEEEREQRRRALVEKRNAHG